MYRVARCFGGAGSRRKHFALLLLIAACIGIATSLHLIGSDRAQAQSPEPSYWLRRGHSIVGECPGVNTGESSKAANRDEGWVEIKGVLSCKDNGESYTFTFKWLGVSISAGSRGAMDRERVNFDWIGLAVYAGRNNGQNIDWIYDEALPINGSLGRADTAPVYFGNLTFDVSKAQLKRSTHFTFYLTAEGLLFPFGLI